MIVPATYGARSTKRKRRTKAEIEQVETAIYSALLIDKPMTVRQVFYRLVSTATIDKTEAEYKTVCRLLGRMRRGGQVPFDWIADNTRWMRKPSTHNGHEDLLDDTARLYRRSVWSNQDAYVEIWLEKDALSGVLYPVTSKWDVPLMVTRGYPSITFTQNAAESIAWESKPAHIYYLGDHDPSGVDIPVKVERDLREFAPDADITFERIAVNPEHIETMGLSTRPTKKSDSRARNFKGESVELDAIPPADLRTLVADVIEQHIDHTALHNLNTVEASERGYLKDLARVYGEGESCGS